MLKQLIVIVLFLFVSTLTIANETQRTAINSLLDTLHLAAANGDKSTYLDLFSENSVFMGTDDWERWPYAEFKKYVDKRFVDGKGWSYQSESRNINFSGDGNTAWFDEIMVSEQWGKFRGTGVVIRSNEQWKIAFYSLTLLVPNEAWKETTRLVTEAYESRDSSN